MIDADLTVGTQIFFACGSAGQPDDGGIDKAGPALPTDSFINRL